MSSEPRADVSDMYMAHTMFRREIGLVSGLIRGVAGGDVERAGVVADHFRLVDAVLGHHHRGEDEHLWQRLLERTGGQAAPVVEAMEAQHKVVDRLLAEVRVGLDQWRATADPVEGSRLAETAGRLSARLAEHLDAEEESALPLAARHITAGEWDRMVADGAVGVPHEHMALIFGMMIYEAEPAVVRQVIATMPAGIRSVVADGAAQAFAEHALRVHGTASPPRSTARESAAAR